MTDKHKYQRKHAAGHGSWLQCDNCGAASHSGYYWLAGFKSKVEPPCKTPVFGSDWANSAERDGLVDW